MSVTAERESGIDSMTFKSPGHEPVTITGDETESALDKLDQAAEHLKRNRAGTGQLSFKVGGDAVGEKLIGSLAISGSIPINENLDLGDEIQIKVVSASGVVLATVAAEAGTPNFKQSHKRRLLAREINQQLHHGRDQ